MSSAFPAILNVILDGGSLCGLVALAINFWSEVQRRTMKRKRAVAFERFVTAFGLEATRPLFRTRPNRSPDQEGDADA